ncbi:MAG: ABC transporter ATP-binding protein [Candidatus Odinarchaeota archaeon]
MLEMNRIYHYYGSARVLAELNFKIEKNTLTAIIGPNGAGKSTILRLISGLEKPNRGTIKFLGERIDGLKAHKIARLGIAQSPDRRRLFYDSNVSDNLRMGAYLLKDKEKYRKLKYFVYEVFPRLKERRKQRAGTLSGGEQQMLAIARALMADPKLLLLDEPSVGLAPKIKTDIFKAIKKIKEAGTTTVLVEQNRALAMEVSDMIHILEDGRIDLKGTSEELRREPRVKKIYLGM